MLEVTRAVDGGAGVLYIYGNYGGDVMNFDLAAELAGLEGIEVATVLGADDVASAPKGEERPPSGHRRHLLPVQGRRRQSRRGRLARRGDRRRRACREPDRGRMGVALSPCTLPAAGRPTFELPDGEMEIGMGIHGEPGIRRGPLEPADRIADSLVDAILADMHIDRGESVAVLVNGLGATPQEELYILYRRVQRSARWRGHPHPSRPTSASTRRRSRWPVHPSRSSDSTTSCGASSTHRAPDRSSSSDDRAAPTSSCAVAADVEAAADELNRLDAAAGDGDLGVTMTRAAEAARSVVGELDQSDIQGSLRRLGTEIARRAPSTSGTLLATGLLRASRVELGDVIDGPAASALLDAAVAGIVERGKASPGDKTMLDALVPAADALRRAAGQGVGLTEALAESALAARAGAEATVAMRPSIGRAAWMPDRSVGHVDAGAYLAGLILGSLARQAATDDLGDSGP